MYKLKVAAWKLLPPKLARILRLAVHPKDWIAIQRFLANGALNATFSERLSIVLQSIRTGIAVECAHTHAEALAYVEAILSLPRNLDGVLVEAGCFKGGSTAKLSMAADVVGRELVVFDSFEGIPENSEDHGRNIFGDGAAFDRGDYRGGLAEVKGNVARHGRIDACRFVPGWFEDTLPHMREPIAAAFVDVDLASSTRTCLKYLYPLLQPGGIIFSHDGHLPLVLEVLEDDAFWENEVGSPRPRIEGLHTSKVVRIYKSANEAAPAVR